MSPYAKSILKWYGGLTLILIGLCLLCIVLVGCTHSHSLTPAQIATTQPAFHPLENVNVIIHHTQTVLESLNILAFVATLAGLGLVVYGALTADKPLEHIGLLVAAVAGTTTAGILAGLVLLPFAPWIIGVIFVGGAGCGAYLLYEDLIEKKHTTIIPVTPAAKD